MNGTSVVTNGVANVPMATSSTPGAVIIDMRNGSGVQILDGKLQIIPASLSDIKGSWGTYRVITPPRINEATFYGLAKAAGDTTQSASSNAVGTYTETALSKISQMLNAPVTVSGTTPTINAMAGVRYVFGECATLDITVPESGCVDVVFESGSTPTVLTVTSVKTGVSAIKWAGGWDGTCEANTVYEINVLDGEYGVMAEWT